MVFFVKLIRTAVFIVTLNAVLNLFATLLAENLGRLDQPDQLAEKNTLASLGGASFHGVRLQAGQFHDLPTFFM